jgi:hypothetical protein
LSRSFGSILCTFSLEEEDAKDDETCNEDQTTDSTTDSNSDPDGHAGTKT